jgi:DNA-binding PucR family transcriptional regulator
MEDFITTYWHQIVMVVGLVWAASRKFGELERRIEIQETKTETADEKLKELFRLHNQSIERMLSKLKD